MNRLSFDLPRCHQVRIEQIIALEDFVALEDGFASPELADLLPVPNRCTVWGNDQSGIDVNDSIARW